MTENNYTVYIHISPNNKYYIGITSQNPKQRWNNGYGYHHNQYFKSAIKKYKWENFQHEIIASNLSKEEACNFEKLLIERLNTTDRRFGYNQSIGGETGALGSIRTEETKKKLSDAHIGLQAGENHPMYNKHHTKETREKMSENHADFSGENHPMYGKKHSKETRRKMSENHWDSSGKNHPSARAVILLNTGEVFATAKEVLNTYVISYKHICSCCKGKRKSCGKLPNGTPMMWMYYEDYIKQQESEVA